MTHDEILRAAYAAFANGDLAGYLQYCTPNMTFVVPGQNKVAGSYDRETFQSGLIVQVMGLTNGSFRETVLDVFTSDRGGIVRAAHEFERNGERHAYNTLYLYGIVGGKLASFREIPEDLDAFNRAWA